MIKINRKISFLLIFFACVLWGLLYSLIKIGYSAIKIRGNNIPDIFVFAGLRFLITGFILTVFYSVKVKKLEIPKNKTLYYVLLISLFTIIIHYALNYVGLAYCEASKSSILKQVGYLLLTAFAFLFRKEDVFDIKKVLGGIIGFVAIIIINLDGSSLSFGIGELLILLASFMAVIGSIFSKNAFDKISPTYSVAWSQFIGGLVLTVVGFIFGGRINAFNLYSVGILLLIVVVSMLAYVFWNIGIKYYDISKASIIKFAEPLFGVIFSGIIMNENIFKITYLISFILIFLGILISEINFKRKVK